MLYLRPKMRMTLRGQPVHHKSPTAGLCYTMDMPPYTPRGSKAPVVMYLGLELEEEEAAAGPATGPLAPGATVKPSQRRGVAFYWDGRLIRWNELLGFQRGQGHQGAGVCGFVDMRDLLTPLPTKQLFEECDEKTRALKELGLRLTAFNDKLMLDNILDVNQPQRVLTAEVAAVVARVRSQRALEEAVLRDPRRALECEACAKHRFVADDMSDDEYDALCEAPWRCNMSADADRNTCDAAQEAPQRGSAPESEEPNPAWLTAFGLAAAGWRTTRTARVPTASGCAFFNSYFAPDGRVFRSKRNVEHVLRSGGEAYMPAAYSRRSMAEPAAAGGGSGRKAGKGKGKRAAARDEEEEEEEEEEEVAAAPKRARQQSLTAQLHAVALAKESANREIARQEKALRRKQQQVDAANAAFEKKCAAEMLRKAAEARRSSRLNPDGAGGASAMPPPPAPPRARAPRLCICDRTAAECGNRLTVTCDECEQLFHAECLLLAHDVAQRMSLECKDHSAALIAARLAAAPLLREADHGARCGAGAAAATPSNSASAFLHVVAAGAAEDDARSDGLPVNWPTRPGSAAFLTHNIHTWPQSEDEWQLVHAMFAQRPLDGVRIRKLPAKHPLTKGALVQPGSKPRGLFATRAFKADEYVGDYVGHVRCACAWDRR